MFEPSEDAVDVLAGYQRRIGVVTAEIEDACIEHGVNGFLKHDDILAMVSEYDKEDFEARAMGRPQHLVGRVFKKWARPVHVIKPFPLDRRDWVISMAYDTHPRNPEGILWVAVNRNGTKVFCNELYLNGTTEEIAERIKAVEREHDYRIDKRLLEPAGYITDQRDERKLSIADKLQTQGLYFTPGSKRRDAAITRIKDALDYTKVGEQYVKEPEVFVFDTLNRLTWEMDNWVWDNWRGKTADNRNPKEKPVDKDDHQIENMGRLLLEDLVYFEEEAETAVYTPMTLDPYDKF